jgi:hypothetical protein
VESGHALAELLAEVPYRQWVLVLPKRLRYFVHRDSRLPGEISRLLAGALTDFYVQTYVEAQDRAGLERLLLYVLRPALSLKALTYKPEQDLVRYRPGKGKPDSPAVLEWSGAEFVGRIAALIPPARKHLVRYYGALGPRSPLRRAVSQAARQKAGAAELTSGYSVTVIAEVARAARKAARASARAWAACIKRVFQVDPVLCVKCGGSMALVAIILSAKNSTPSIWKRSCAGPMAPWLPWPRRRWEEPTTRGRRSR